MWYQEIPVINYYIIRAAILKGYLSNFQGHFSYINIPSVETVFSSVGLFMRSSKFNTSFTITSQGVVLQLRIARYAFWESKIGLPLFSSTTTNHRLYYIQKIGRLQRRKTQQCRKFQVVPFSRCFAARQNSKLKIGHLFITMWQLLPERPSKKES